MPADRLREILTTYPSGEYNISCIRISHPLMSQEYLFTQQPGGLTAIDNNLIEVVFNEAQYEEELQTDQNDLDQIYKFTFADPNNVLDDELERIPNSNIEPIRAELFMYINTNLTEHAIYVDLDVASVTQPNGAFSFTAGPRQLHYNQTGEIYDTSRFVMLRAV